MKRKLICILLTLCTLLSLTACQDSASPAPADPGPAVTEPEATEPETPSSEPEGEPDAPALDPSLSQRDRDWIEDIEFLREKYKTTHMDPFYLCTEEEFDFRLDQLEAKVSELSDTDIYYELKAVLAGMGDLHTYIYLTSTDTVYDGIYDRRFPIKAQFIGGKVYLYSYLEGYEQFAPYLLREIVAVNGIDITYLQQKSAMVEKPLNDWSSKEWFGSDVVSPTFLDWAGCDYTEGYTIQILNENQEVESIEVPVITSEAYEGVWAYPENWDRLYYSRSGDWAEYIEDGNGGCIYMHYVNLASAVEIMEIFDATAALIEEHPECGKLVIDLRDHPGGSPDRVAMVQECTKQLDAPTIEQTYVVTGGFTASGAIDCLGFFRDILDAVVIGEPTAQFASFFYVDRSEGTFVLPNSQIAGRVSTAWYDTSLEHEAYYGEDGRLYEWENTILPDVYVHQDIDDIRQGRDSVLQWVLAQ